MSTSLHQLQLIQGVASILRQVSELQGSIPMRANDPAWDRSINTWLQEAKKPLETVLRSLMDLGQ